MADIFRSACGVTMPLPLLERLKYADAMLRYGSDKPDLRYGMEIVDSATWRAQTEFPLFKDALAAGGKVRGLNAKGAAEKFSRKDLDELAEQRQAAQGQGAGLGQGRGGQVRLVDREVPAPAVQQELRKRLAAQPGDLLSLRGGRQGGCRLPGAGHAAHATWRRKLDLVDPAKRIFKIAWVLDFPSFIWDEEEKRWAANHHPFTAPRDEDLASWRATRATCGPRRTTW